MDPALPRRIRLDKARLFEDLGYWPHAGQQAPERLRGEAEERAQAKRDLERKDAGQPEPGKVPPFALPSGIIRLLKEEPAMTLSFRSWSCIPALVLATSTLAAQSSFFDCDPAAPNNALELDGEFDFASVDYDPTFPIAEFTLSAWMKAVPPSPTLAFCVIVGQGEDDGTDNTPWNLIILPDGHGSLLIENSAGNDDNYPTTGVVADSAWHHLAATRDPLGTVHLYVDGVLDATFSSTIVPADGVDQRLTIGCWIGDDSTVPIATTWRFLSGTLDEVALWSRALSATEVQEMYAHGTTVSPGIVGAWSFDEASGQTLIDASPLENDGTLGASREQEIGDPERALALSCPLSALGTDLSVAAGGTQRFMLAPGSEFALMLYFLAGTATGTSPGFTLGSLAIPLNPDAFFFYTVNHPNVDPYKKTLGFLTSAGEGSARITIPPGSAPSLVGLQLHHAYLVWDVLGGAGAVFASNAVPVTFVP